MDDFLLELVRVWEMVGNASFVFVHPSVVTIVLARVPAFIAELLVTPVEVFSVLDQLSPVDLRFAHRPRNINCFKTKHLSLRPVKGRHVGHLNLSKSSKL